MARNRFHGVNTVWKTLADGTRRPYHFHRASKTRLPDDQDSTEFAEAWAAAERGTPKDEGKVGSLIANI